MYFFSVVLARGSDIKDDDQNSELKEVNGLGLLWQYDMLDLRKPYLPRSALLDELHTMVMLNVFSHIPAPPASGKSSLIQLYRAAHPEQTTVILSLFGKTDPVDHLRRKTGIDIEMQEWHTNFDPTRKYVVILDDSHEVYNDGSFWKQLLKTPAWLPSNLRFVIVATHSVFIPNSPVDLKTLPKLTRDKFVLSESESFQFLDLSSEWLKSHPYTVNIGNIIDNREVQGIISAECGGQVGALMVTVNSLHEQFLKQPDLTEPDIVQYFFSHAMLQNYKRCFVHGLSRLPKKVQQLLLSCVWENTVDSPTFPDNGTDLEKYETLLKSGVLASQNRLDGIPKVKFASPLAMRFVHNLMYPQRANLPLPAHITAFDLGLQVIASMSARALSNSVARGSGDFPKEAVFQQHFMQGLLLLTTANNHVCPEISRTFPLAVGQKSTLFREEADFYVNGAVRIGFELLRKGRDWGKHKDRFDPAIGCYRFLKVRDFALIDFTFNQEGIPTSVEDHPQRITVFFKKGDFTECQVKCGFLAAVKVTLKN